MESYRLIKFRGKFAVEFMENGRRRRASLGTTDRAEVSAAIVRLDRRLQEARNPRSSTSNTFGA
jgi:hypothetical protein